jgi:hypothetical protein
MKPYRYSPAIFDLGIRLRWVVSVTPWRITPRERAPGTYWVEGWGGRKAGLDTVEESLLQLPGIESRPVAIRTELSQL